MDYRAAIAQKDQHSAVPVEVPRWRRWLRLPVRRGARDAVARRAAPPTPGPCRSCGREWPCEPYQQARARIMELLREEFTGNSGTHW